MNARASRHGRNLLYGISTTLIRSPYQQMAESQALATEEARLHIREGRSAISALGAGLVGTPQVVTDRMRRYEVIGVDCCMLRFPQQAEGLEQFEENVTPLIADRLDKKIEKILSPQQPQQRRQTRSFGCNMSGMTYPRKWKWRNGQKIAYLWFWRLETFTIIDFSEPRLPAARSIISHCPMAITAGKPRQPRI